MPFLKVTLLQKGLARKYDYPTTDEIELVIANDNKAEDGSPITDPDVASAKKDLLTAYFDSVATFNTFQNAAPGFLGRFAVKGTLGTWHASVWDTEDNFKTYSGNLNKSDAFLTFFEQRTQMLQAYNYFIAGVFPILPVADADALLKDKLTEAELIKLVNYPAIA